MSVPDLSLMGVVDTLNMQQVKHFWEMTELLGYMTNHDFDMDDVTKYMDRILNALQQLKHDLHHVGSPKRRTMAQPFNALGERGASTPHEQVATFAQRKLNMNSQNINSQNINSQNPNPQHTNPVDSDSSEDEN